MQIMAEKPTKHVWVSINEAAKELGVSRETIRRFIVEDKVLPAYQFRNMYKIDRVDLEQFVERQRTIPRDES